MEGYRLRKRSSRKPDYTSKKKRYSRHELSAVKVKMEPEVGLTPNRAMTPTTGTFPFQEDSGSSGHSRKQTSSHSSGVMAPPEKDHHLCNGAETLHVNKTAETCVNPVTAERKRAKRHLTKKLSPYLTRLRANRKLLAHRASKPTSTSGSRSSMVNPSPPDVPEESPVDVVTSGSVGSAIEPGEGADNDNNIDISNDSPSLHWARQHRLASMPDRRLRKVVRELVAKRMMKLNNSLVFDPRIATLARRILLLERENRNLSHTAKTLSVALFKALKREKRTESRGTQVTMGMILSRASAANKGRLDDTGHCAIQTAQVSSAVNKCGLTSQSQLTSDIMTSATHPLGSNGVVRPSVQGSNDNYVGNAGNRSQRINVPLAVGTKDTSELSPTSVQVQSALNQTVLADPNGMPVVLSKSCFPPSQNMVALSETIDGQTNENTNGEILTHPDTWATVSHARKDTHSMVLPRHLSIQNNRQHASLSASPSVHSRGYPYSVMASNQNASSMQIPPNVSQPPEQLRSHKENIYMALTDRVPKDVTGFVPIAPRPAQEHPNSYNPYHGWFQHQASVLPATNQTEQRNCPQDCTQTYSPQGNFYQTGILPANCLNPDYGIQHNNIEASRQGYSLSSSTYQLHRSFGKPSQYHSYTARQPASAGHDGFITHQTVGPSSFEKEKANSSMTGLYSLPSQEMQPSRGSYQLSSHLKQLQEMSAAAMPDGRRNKTAKEQQLGSVGQVKGRHWTKRVEGHVRQSTKQRQWTFHHVNTSAPGPSHFVRSTSQHQHSEACRETWDPWIGRYSAVSRTGKRTALRDMRVFPPGAGNHASSSVYVGQQQAQREQHELLLQTPRRDKQQYNQHQCRPSQQHDICEMSPQLQPSLREESTTGPVLQQEPNAQPPYHPGLQSQLPHQQSQQGEEEKEAVPTLDEEHGQKQNQEHLFGKGTGQVQDAAGEQQHGPERKQELRDQTQKQLRMHQEHQSQQFQRLLPPQPRWQRGRRHFVQLTPNVHTTASPYEYIHRQTETEGVGGRDRAAGFLNHCSVIGSHMGDEVSAGSSLERPPEASENPKSTQRVDNHQIAQNTAAHDVVATKELHHQDNPQSLDAEQISDSTFTPPVDNNCSENIPPKPVGHVIEKDHNVVFSWNIRTEGYAKIKSFELYILTNDTTTDRSSPVCWTQIGIVDALPLPMACTLSQFYPGVTYSFKVRAVNVSGLVGPYSEPCSITLEYS